MKRISAAENGITHIEARGCIVNIYAGLADKDGRAVTRVDVICDHHAGEPGWSLIDHDNHRAIGLRVAQELPA